MSSQRRAAVLIATAVLSCLPAAAAGCASASAHGSPSPATSSAGPSDTVSRAGIGATLTVTATVERVITVNAFVVGDDDLPDRGLLVFGVARRPLRPTDLVTVRGTVEQFRFSTFAPRFAMSDAGRYQPFDGHRVLIAEEIRSDA
ncbi:hypothetical protein [Actinoplanes sp. NPDC051411]|jgi:hypothetical protein|uniref:hypothetical protein n=1 Tax=unclassified Actinoplanes TaxID=2626549 RepID=UPI00343AEF85